MKNLPVKYLSAGLICLSLYCFANSQVKKRTIKAVEPTAKEAVRQILLNADLPLSSGKNCQSIGTAKDDKTILDFLSGVLSFQSAPESGSRMEFTFNQEKDGKNEIVWICDVLFTGKNTEDVWSNGIRFKMRNSDRKLLRNSMMCIGTG